MPKNGNGKIIKIASAAAVIVGLLVGIFELKEYIAWAEDLEALRAEFNMELCMRDKEAAQRQLGALRLQQYQWLQLEAQHPNDPHIKATLQQIEEDIKAEQEKLKGKQPP